MKNEKPSQLIIVLLFVSVVIFFGSSWLGNKIVLDQGVPPLFAAAMRYTIAAFILSGIWFLRPYRPKITSTDIRAILLYGVIMIALVNALTFEGMQFLSSSLSSIIFSIYPILILLLSHMLLQDDKMTAPKVLGTFIGFLGVILLFYKKDLFSLYPEQFWGMLIVFFATAMNAIPNVLLKRTIEKTDVLTLTAGGMISGSLILWTMGLIRHGSLNFTLNAPVIFSELYLGIFCSSAGFLFYFMLLKWMKASTLALTAYLTPLVAIFLGVMFYGESLSLNHIGGMLLIFAGVYLARQVERRNR